jgi:glutamine amidotransferase
VITIVDYGVGNLGSIANMLKRIRVPARISADLGQIRDAEKLILPGVGHFDRAMERLAPGTPLREVLDHKATVEQVPVLGICLGMQLLTEGSEEGERPGLGWVPGRTRRFRLAPESGLKVPHMGWKVVRPATPSPLTAGADAWRFYFVHSYHVCVDDPADAVLLADHGVQFLAAIQRGNVYGVQFHPEKSHRFGMKLLENFANA